MLITFAPRSRQTGPAGALSIFNASPGDALMKRISQSNSILRLAVAGLIIGFAVTARAQTATPTPTPQSSPQPSPLPVSTAKPEDVATMDAIVTALYDVISGPPGKRD